MKTIKQYVAGFYFKGGKVLLIQKKKPPWQYGRFNGVGGKVEDSDVSPREAMTREFREETGLPILPERWTCFARLSGIVKGSNPEEFFEVWWYRTSYLQGDKEPKSITSEPVSFHSLSFLPEVIPNLRWLLPMSDECQKHTWPLDIIERDLLPR
jgi:8-oxo-dGTP diphosphatase